MTVPVTYTAYAIEVDVDDRVNFTSMASSYSSAVTTLIHAADSVLSEMTFEEIVAAKPSILVGGGAYTFFIGNKTVSMEARKTFGSKGGLIL